jgi:RNA polymerase sigma-70 factor (ECF subfamily)
VENSSFASTSMTLLGRLRQDSPDEEAWAEFVRRYGGQIHRWCRRWGLQEADAEDVTQTVLAKLAQKMPTFQYDPAGSFRGYVKALTHTAWARLLEGQQRPGGGSGSSTVFDLLRSVEARADLLEHLRREFDQEALAEAMQRVQARVEPQTWEAFRLTALEGLPGAAAAERLGMKVASVFKARSRVQALLQQEIEAQDASDPP